MEVICVSFFILNTTFFMVQSIKYVNTIRVGLSTFCVNYFKLRNKSKNVEENFSLVRV